MGSCESRRAVSERGVLNYDGMTSQLLGEGNYCILLIVLCLGNWD